MICHRPCPLNPALDTQPQSPSPQGYPIPPTSHPARCLEGLTFCFTERWPPGDWTAYLKGAGPFLLQPCRAHYSSATTVPLSVTPPWHLRDRARPLASLSPGISTSHPLPNQAGSFLRPGATRRQARALANACGVEPHADPAGERAALCPQVGASEPADLVVSINMHRMAAEHQVTTRNVLSLSPSLALPSQGRHRRQCES